MQKCCHLTCTEAKHKLCVGFASFFVVGLCIFVVVVVQRLRFSVSAVILSVLVVVLHLLVDVCASLK